MSDTVYRVYLDGYITEKKARRTIGELYGAASEYPGCAIEFVINSQGGCIPDGTAIYSELRAMSERGGGEHHVTTKVRGMAGSIATLIFEAGDLRVGGPLDVLIYHESKLTLHNEFTSSIRNRLVDMDRWDNFYIDTLMERATASREEILALNGPVDREITIPQAVEYGLADRVA